MISSCVCILSQFILIPMIVELNLFDILGGINQIIAARASITVLL